MITIQELGLSIMSDSPAKVYIVGGDEYGIKDKYIDTLTKFYGKKEEYPSVQDVLNIFNVKHFIPLKPTLYVVRYDDNFVSKISADLAKKVKNANILGTLFCIYNEPKHIAKLDKYLPEHVCTVDAVNPKFIEKYLTADFPELDSRSIQIATKLASNYGHARTLCKSMSQMERQDLTSMTEMQFAKLFGCESASCEEDMQKAVAGRNFAAASQLLDTYEGDLDSLIYMILRTMIELEKVMTSKYAESPLKDYAKCWKLEYVYNLFMNTYSELQKLRSGKSSNIKATLIYLFGLFTFKDIPSPEVMNAN